MASGRISVPHCAETLVQKLKEKHEFREPGGCCGTEILKSSPLASGNILKSSPLSSGNPQLVPLVGTSIFRSASSALWSPREWTHVSGILVGVQLEGSNLTLLPTYLRSPRMKLRLVFTHGTISKGLLWRRDKLIQSSPCSSDIIFF